MTDTAHYLTPRGEIGPRALLRWLLYRIAVYASITAVGGLLFLIGAAFYSYVWPAPPPFRSTSTEQVIPQNVPIPTLPPKPDISDVPIARGNSNEMPAMSAPLVIGGEIANLVVGTQILDSHNVLVGGVEKINTNAQGQKEIVVNMLGPFTGLLMVSADQIQWTRGEGGKVTRGTIPFSIVDIQKKAEAALASQPSGSRGPVRVSVPSINSAPTSVTVTPTSPPTTLTK